MYALGSSIMRVSLVQIFRSIILISGINLLMQTQVRMLLLLPMK